MATNAQGLLENKNPVNPSDPTYTTLFNHLQGNILKGHGRDFSVNIFLEFRDTGLNLRNQIAEITQTWVTSAAEQSIESDFYKKFKIPGALFGNLFLTVGAYHKLGLEEHLKDWFEDKDLLVSGAPVFPLNSTFLKGMKAAAADLGDIPEDLEQIDPSKIDMLSPIQKRFLFDKGKITEEVVLEPLEAAYYQERIDAMLLLADDSEEYLLRKARELIMQLEKSGIATVLAVELGKALRNREQEGIEHFGYVDGRSQPLFLADDFKNLQDGAINVAVTTEHINEKAIRRESGAIDIWNPFAPLSLVLKADPGTNAADAFGSYFVFRKLEQDVMRFTIAEQNLADALKLTGIDRERAGAMAVGRFRDGTPLVLSESDGLIPAKANNFRYDGKDASNLPNPLSVNDGEGLRCPFHAHIRKTNPRQNNNEDREKEDRKRAIVRRGIPYGDRNKEPNAFQALDDLPTNSVGLLFACFQQSIASQFAFMQKTWANNVNFKEKGSGIDPLVGQALTIAPGGNSGQHWRKEYSGVVTEDSSLSQSHPVSFTFSDFVKFRGGAFFFAPSMPFLLNANPE